MPRRFLFAVGLAFCATAAAAADGAYPMRPVRLIVGYPPGGSSAAEFRAFIESESRRWLKVAQDAGVKPE